MNDPLLAIGPHLQVASPLDIAGTKMAVIQKRASFRDYIDLHTLVEKGISLEQALAAAQAIYGKVFSPSISLKALMYYEDGTLPDLPVSVRQRLTLEAQKVRVDRIPHLTGRPGLTGS